LNNDLINYLNINNIKIIFVLLLLWVRSSNEL